MNPLPKIVTKRTQGNLHAALQRAESNKDKPKADHIRNLLNGAVPLPLPNVKKVK